MQRQAPRLLRLERSLRRVYVVLAILATLAGIGIVGLVGTSVAMRHIANAPFRFTEELVGLLMTAAFFLALPLVTLNSDHVKVKILTAALPTRLAGWLGIAAAAFGITFSIWVFLLGLPWFEFAYERAIKTEVGRLLMYPWMALLPLSMLLTTLAFIVRATNGPVQEPGESTLH